VVALGTPAELARKLGRSQRLELEVARGDEETVLRLLTEAPGVSAHRKNGTIVAAGQSGRLSLGWSHRWPPPGCASSG